MKTLNIYKSPSFGVFTGHNSKSPSDGMFTGRNSKFPSDGGVSEGRGGSFGGSHIGSLFKLLALLIILFLSIPSYAQTNFQWEWFATGGKYCGMGSEIKDIVCDDSGNVYGIGTSTGNQIFGSDTIKSLGNDDIIILKYDSSGNVKWGKLLGGASWEQGYSIVLDKQGNIFICGGFHDSTYIDNIKLKSNGWYDVFFAKLNNAGETIWAKNYGSASQDRGVKLAIDSQDNIYMLGYAYCVSGSTSITIDNNTASLQCGEMFLAKFNATGICLWNKRVGGTGMENVVQTVQLFNDSLIYVAGLYEKNFTLGNYSFKTSNYLSNAFFSVFRDNGTLKFAKAMGNENSYEWFTGLDFDKKGNMNFSVKVNSESLTINDSLYANNSNGTKSVLFVFDSLYNIIEHYTTTNIIAGKFTFDDDYNIISAGSVGQNPIIVWNDTIIKTDPNVDRYILKQNSEGKILTSYLVSSNNLYLDMTKILYNNGNIYMCGNLNIGTAAKPWFLDLDTNHITDVGWFITKIKQIDSTTVGIDNGKLTMENRELTVFPNPAND
ncbi:MAG: hypothetical protein A2X02_02240, partial [Bacteroidetes bacterium GWF2_29_10]